VETVVDAIGGVDVELTAAEAGFLSRKYGGMKTGVTHLNGEQALYFARLRSIDSDWQRVERQRRVILAAVEALKGASMKQLDDLLNETLPLIQTDMSMLEIADMMLYAPNFLKSEFDQMTIPKAGTYGYKDGIKGFAVDYEVNSQILRDFLYGTEEEE
jgi:anionic cell wall polymer biosynthesis LytR-Cps2A-Psr (LCP) family protein